jgi:hypothetical protein
MIRFGNNDYPQTAMVWKVEDKGKYASVRLGTSRKDKQTNKYIASTWSFVRFVGEAYKNILDVEEKTKIIILSGSISLEPYQKDGQTMYPQNPQITVFSWEYAEPRDSQYDSAPVVESDDNELPF